MRETHCPVCATELEVRDVAPCFECGADPHELEELTAGKHSYAELRAFGEELVLCDFCQADFTSYDPAYFNRPRGTKLGLEEFAFIRELRAAGPSKDKFCARCNHRLAFLRFLVRVRATAQAL